MGEAGGRGIGGHLAQSELHELSSPLFEQERAEAVLSTSWGCESGTGPRDMKGSSAKAIQDQSICQQNLPGYLWNI